MENDKRFTSSYHILVAETLDQQFTGWYGELTILPQKKGRTLILGTFPDQSALRGFLDQLWNLNITVLTVERIENED